MNSVAWVYEENSIPPVHICLKKNKRKKDQITGLLQKCILLVLDYVRKFGCEKNIYLQFYVWFAASRLWLNIITFWYTEM